MGLHFKKGKIQEGLWQKDFIPHVHQEEIEETVSSWRLVFLGSICLLAFFGLFLRVFHLQIVEGEKNRELADSNRIQIKVIHAPRGVIYDRSGKILAENNPGFRLDEKFISRDESLSLEAKNDPNFLKMEIDTIRFYPLGKAFSHVLGYVGQISSQELEDETYQKNYKIGDRLGRAGIEQIYEAVLKGKDGAEIIEIDATGKRLRTLRKVDPVPGKNIYLSLDADLQKVAYQALEKKIAEPDSCCGAVVAQDPKSGEILALVSLPAYDNNAFTDPKRNKEVTEYFTSQNAPLINRAISGSYPPGSTFKITSALAGLSLNKINASTEIEDTGIMYLGPWSFSNWYFTQYGGKDGMVDVTKALQRSNDIFFYRVGEMVGEEVLGETAKKLGFGKKLGIDLPGEVEGLVPDNSWKEKNIGEGWYPGDTLHMAIGQGFLLATPLQILAQTSYIATDGGLTTPHLIKKITTPNGVLIKEYNYQPLKKNIFKKEDLALVKAGLAKVPKEGGTAWPFFNFAIVTAGKTGTAEYGDPRGRTHAWYTSYAPADDPKIAATVLIEAGGEGSSIAAPVVLEIYTWYFNPDKGSVKSLENDE